MLSLIDIYKFLCDDLHIESSDKQYILNRIKSEGVGFVSSTLPTLAKCVLHAIEIGNLYEAIQITNFTSIARKGRSLRYFRSLLGMIFSVDDGSLLEDPSSDALLRLRSLCEYAYKLNLPFTEAELKTYTASFVSNDAAVGQSVDDTFVDEVRIRTEQIYADWLNTDPHNILVSHQPRPGSGTYSGAPGDWYRFKNEPSPYKFRNFIVGSLKGLLRQFGSKQVRPGSSPATDYSELLFVPKDARGPRTIVREPRDNLLFQLSFHDWFTDTIQSASAGRIQFTSQLRNREIAHEGSVSGAYATIDLRNASDMVPYKVVSKIFGNFPSIMFFLKRFRTNIVKLPNGSFHPLKKLSGMGSGFTFPMMAFLCHTSISTAIARVTGVTYAAASRQVYVFGDDICLPTKYVDIAFNALQNIGFEVNTDKSYWRGPFRESCGGDYLRGYDVSPPRLKLSSSGISTKGVNLYPERRDNFIFELSQHCKELAIRGLFRLQSYYESVVSRKVPYYPFCSNFEFQGVVRYRAKAFYVPDLCTGTYPTVKVCLFKPVSISQEDPGYRLYGKLYRGNPSTEYIQPVDHTKIDIPRRGKLQIANVSAYSLCSLDADLSDREALLF